MTALVPLASLLRSVMHPALFNAWLGTLPWHRTVGGGSTDDCVLHTYFTQAIDFGPYSPVLAAQNRRYPQPLDFEVRYGLFASDYFLVFRDRVIVRAVETPSLKYYREVPLPPWAARVSEANSGGGWMDVREVHRLLAAPTGK